MSDDETALRGETAQLIKELGLANFQFDDDDEPVAQKKDKANKKKLKASPAPAKASAASAPAKASTASAPAKASTASAPAKASTTSAPAKASTASAPAAGKKTDAVKNEVKGKEENKKVKPAVATGTSGAKPPSKGPDAQPATKPAGNGTPKQLAQQKQVAPQKTTSNNAPKVVSKSALPPWMSNKGNKGRGLDLPACSTDGHWYDPLSVLPAAAPNTRIDASVLSAITDSVQDKFTEEVSRYHDQRKDRNDADSKWLREVIQAGTLSDRVAALAMQVQESPLHHLRTLDTLVDMCCKKEQRVAQLAIEATKDLLLHNILPDRLLVPFSARDMFAPAMTMPLAVLSWFEGELVHRVARFVGALEVGTMVNADYFKKLCLDVSTDMLIAKPEQESRHLALVANKLGDPSSPICQKAMECLKKIVYKHPAMIGVVIREVRNFISRPNLSVRALFTSILFLSQIPLRNDSGIAAQLVECYVSLFEKSVQREESGSRLLYALLTGINRAFPFLTDREPILCHLDALFRIVHNSAFTTSTQALTLISHIALKDDKPGKKQKDKKETSESETSLINRFYRALYEKLLSSELSTRARNTLFLNLLFRSMKRDPSVERVMAFIKRLMICVTQSASNIAAGFMFLIAEVCRHRADVLRMITEVEVPSENVSNKGEEMHAFGNFNVEKREPLYAVPENSCPALWEASLMRQHFHPSVKAFATSWLTPPTHTVKFDGDPITEFSITAFLNRFSYKNPKTRNMDKVHRPLPKAEDPVNSDVFVGADEDTISPDKAFFHKYFGSRIRLLGEGKLKDKSRRKADNESEDGDMSGEEGGEVDDEAEMDKYADSLAETLMKSAAGNEFNRPDIDDDLDFSSDGEDEEDEAIETGSAAEFDAAAEDEEESEEDADYEAFMRANAAGADDDEDEEMDIDSDEDGIADFSEDDMSEEEEELPVQTKGKKRKKSQDDADIFASADDYAYEMEEVMQMVEKKKTADTNNDEQSRKKSKNKHQVVNNSSKGAKEMEVVEKKSLPKKEIKSNNSSNKKMSNSNKKK